MKSISTEYAMYFGAKPDVFKKAKELRKTETQAEKLLWLRLNKNQLSGLQFRRQHPINRFIADFYCPKLKMVIEIDGTIHDLPENKEYDIGRTELLKEFGIIVIRFDNEQILYNIDEVIDKIGQNARKLLTEATEVPQLGDLGGS